MNIFFRNLPIGTVGLSEQDGVLTGLYFQGQFRFPDGTLALTPPLNEAFLQLEAWLKGDLDTFRLPLLPPRTPFEGCVREALLAVTRGRTATYGAIAEAIGMPGSARAVGSACRRNPLPLFIPCHRVVPSSGGPGQYRGGAALKLQLLERERQQRR